MAEMRELRGEWGNGGLMAFLAGAAVGAGIALLLAPRTGTETRRVLRESLESGAIKANIDRGLALLDEAKTRLGEAIEAGREAAHRERARLSREWSPGPREESADGTARAESSAV
jgi:gas vesicle protein